MTRHRELLESPLLAQRPAIFTDAERVIADPIVRNRGTIGGALSRIREAISGQICRCTGYTTIVRSIRWAAEREAMESTAVKEEEEA